MAKVLFTHSYFLKFDPKQWGLQQPYAPLGTLYAASLLRKNGFDVAVHDVMFCDSPDELKPALEREKPRYLVIYDDGFNYLTKMCLTNMREAAFKMARLASDAGCIVIVCSSDSTDHYEKYIAHKAHYIISGEGEITLLELMNALERGAANVKDISGLIFEEQNEVIHTTKRDVISELDQLPFPAYELVNMNAYRSMWMHRYGSFTINMATTRGCPYRCNWCAKPIYGYRYHSRSPQNVTEELKQLYARYSFNKVWFCDDIFGLTPGWIQKFAVEVFSAGLRFRYTIQSRADLLKDEETVAALARSGCETVWLGAESGSQKILDAMDKNLQLGDIYTACRLLKKYGIRPAFFLQFGYPGETLHDISLTIKMLNELLPEDIGISISYPLPGTVFHEKVKNDLKEKANWTDSDELKLMFRNTYSADFYRALHRYVHKNFRKKQGFAALKKLLRFPFAPDYITLKRCASIAYYIPASIIAKMNMNAQRTK
ncbi:MAG: radical SAM protein [Bacteroidota bacterium]